MKTLTIILIVLGSFDLFAAPLYEKAARITKIEKRTAQMIYEEFKADFMKENKKLKIILFLSLIVFSVGTISNLISRKYFLYKGQAIFEERPLAEEICLTGFSSIASGTPNQNLLSKGMYDLVIKEPFPLNIQKILQVQSLELGSCKIILEQINQF